MNRNLPFQYFIVFVLLVLFAPACRPTSGLNLFFEGGTEHPATAQETLKSVMVKAADDDNKSCSAGLIASDIVITAQHCAVDVGSKVIGGVSFLERKNSFEQLLYDGKVVETIAVGEFHSASTGKITTTNADGSISEKEIPVNLHRDVSIHRIKWNSEWFEKQGGQASKSERQFVFKRIWSDPKQYGLTREHISNRSISGMQSIPIEKIKAYSVGFPGNQREKNPYDGRESAVFKPIYSDGFVLNLLAENITVRQQIGYVLNLTTGSFQGNSGGFVAEVGTDVLLGVVMGSGNVHLDGNARHDPNMLTKHNYAVSLMDAYHFDTQVGPVLRRLFDENGYSRNTTTVINDNADPVEQPSLKLSKIGFLPGASATKILVTAANRVTEMSVCGGATIECLPMQDVSKLPRENGVFVTEVSKTIPHSFNGSLPLIVRLKTNVEGEIQEVFELKRIQQ